jgi:hypothetical protein
MNDTRGHFLSVFNISNSGLQCIGKNICQDVTEEVLSTTCSLITWKLPSTLQTYAQVIVSGKQALQKSLIRVYL